MNIQELRGNSLNAFFTLSNHSYLATAAKTAVETQQGEKYRLTCAVVQYGFNTVLTLKKTFLIMEDMINSNNNSSFLELLRKTWLKGAMIGLQWSTIQCARLRPSGRNWSREFYRVYTLKLCSKITVRFKYNLLWQCKRDEEFWCRVKIFLNNWGNRQSLHCIY